MKKKKNNNTKIIIAVVAIVAIVALVVLALLLNPGILSGVLQSNDLTPAEFDNCLTDLQASDIEIFTALRTLMGKPLNYANVSMYIMPLHMKILGDSCYSALEAMELYESDYLLDGWASNGRQYTYGSGWFAYYEVWTRADQARFIAAGEGAILTTTYGYSTVIMSAYGPITTVEQFMMECS